MQAKLSGAAAPGNEETMAYLKKIGLEEPYLKLVAESKEAYTVEGLEYMQKYRVPELGQCIGRPAAMHIYAKMASYKEAQQQG